MGLITLAHRPQRPSAGPASVLGSGLFAARGPGKTVALHRKSVARGDAGSTPSFRGRPAGL